MHKCGGGWLEFVSQKPGDAAGERLLRSFAVCGRRLAVPGAGSPCGRRGQPDGSMAKEVAEGKLSMPREPRTLYVLTGTGFDASSGKVVDAYLRWVIYVPYATAESTGLSTQPSDNAPWLMSPGTADAHIMISPPRK